MCFLSQDQDESKRQGSDTRSSRARQYFSLPSSSERALALTLLTMMGFRLAFSLRNCSTRLLHLHGVFDTKQLAPNLSENESRSWSWSWSVSVLCVYKLFNQMCEDESHDTHVVFIEAHKCIVSSTLQLKLHKCVTSRLS